MSGVGGLFGLNPNSSKDERKQALMQGIQHETNVENARMLIEKINEKCFEKCIPKPGTSLSSGESLCLTNCMQKYMASWNIISAAYIGRIKSDPAI
ncbi:protein translocase subunit [Maublancomyces gigas]|uniref:Mitochondrial import inner membrane translocase subunit n=1 Tax=Discina gigas TaxID=1032678 RepID=A0ABR3GMH6_9PEZI